MELLAAARRIRSATRSHIRQAPRPTSRTTCLDALEAASIIIESSFRYGGSCIIGDFHSELPGTVQYTFTRCFRLASRPAWASVAETAHDSTGSRPYLSLTAFFRLCLRSMPHFEDPAFTTRQMTFGLRPVGAMRLALLVALKTGPVEIPAAVNQLSTASLTHAGTGTVGT